MNNLGKWSAPKISDGYPPLSILDFDLSASVGQHGIILWNRRCGRFKSDQVSTTIGLIHEISRSWKYRCCRSKKEKKDLWV